MAAPSTTSTKPATYRYRYVLKTFVRQEDKKSLAEIRGLFNQVKGAGLSDLFNIMLTWRDKTRIDRSIEIWDKPNKRWMPLT